MTGVQTCALPISDHKYWKSLFEERQEELKVAQEKKAQELADKAAEELLLLEASSKSKSSNEKKPNKKKYKKRNNTSKKSRNQNFLNQGKVEVKASKSSPVKPPQDTTLASKNDPLLTLNNSKSPSAYNLHQRVLRWHELDLGKIRKIGRAHV